MKNVDEQAEWDRVRSWTADVAETPRAMAFRSATAELVKELQAVGVPLTSVSELSNVRLRYPLAYPILLDHARRDYPDPVKGSIFQCLVDRGAGEPLLSDLIAILRDTYGQLSPNSLYTLGYAIAEAAKPKDLDTVIEVANAKKFGVAREPVIMKIASNKNVRAKHAVQRFFREDVAPVAAIDALRIARLWDMHDSVLAYKETPDYSDKAKPGLRESIAKYERAMRKASGKPRA